MVLRDGRRPSRFGSVVNKVSSAARSRKALLVSAFGGRQRGVLAGQLTAVAADFGPFGFKTIACSGALGYARFMSVLENICIPWAGMDVR